METKCALFPRIIRVLTEWAELIDPLSSVPVFYQEMQPAGLSGPVNFDEELNNRVKERALRERKLKGVCNFSGRATEFVVSSDNLRETLVSSASLSINRHRQLVCGLSLNVFGHPRASLAAIASHVNQNKLKLYIAEANSVPSDFLKRRVKRGLFVWSEYFGPDYRSGEIVKGILHEDLQATSFGDDTFDIILTSDVLEHVPNALIAERELMRILKPGGIYCFTVPFIPAAEHDVIFAHVDEHGKTRYFAEPQFHCDPLRPEGALVYRLFSFNDMKERFEAMGHEFKSYRFWSDSLGILGSDCWVHTATKATNDQDS